MSDVIELIRSLDGKLDKLTDEIHVISKAMAGNAEKLNSFEQRLIKIEKDVDVVEHEVNTLKLCVNRNSWLSTSVERFVWLLLTVGAGIAGRYLI